MISFFEKYPRILETLHYPVIAIPPDSTALETYQPADVIALGEETPILLTFSRNIPLFLESCWNMYPIFYIESFLPVEHGGAVFSTSRYNLRDLENRDILRRLLDRIARQIVKTHRENLPLTGYYYAIDLESPGLNLYYAIPQIGLIINRIDLTFRESPRQRLLAVPARDVMIILEPLNPELLRDVSLEQVGRLFNPYIKNLIKYLEEATRDNLFK